MTELNMTGFAAFAVQPIDDGMVPVDNDVVDDLVDDDAFEALTAAELGVTGGFDVAPISTGPVVARFRGVVSRAQWGARAPKNVNRNVTPSKGGIAVHYNGPRIGLTEKSDHAKCKSAVKNMQRYHMDGNGWADIAYNWLACQHGYVFVGRGNGVRSAAQGTNPGNQNYLAVQGVLGEGDKPSQSMLAGIEWVISGARSNGAGSQVLPHSKIHSTACPGKPLTSECRRWDKVAVTVGGSASKAANESPGQGGSWPVVIVPDGYVLDVDGDMGPSTWATWMQAMHFPDSTNKLWSRTQERLSALGQLGRPHVTGSPNPGTTRALQRLAQFPQTGVWDDASATDGVAALQKTMPLVAFPPPKPEPAPDWPLPLSHRIGYNPKKYPTWHDGTGTDRIGNLALKQWQERMMARWWTLGTAGADGYYGIDTDRVVHAFQDRKKITEVGFGPATWVAAWETPRT